MLKKIIRTGLPVVCFILIFLLICYPVQKLLSPRHDSTTIMDGFYSLEKDTLDVLFLGSSHMYFSVDSQLLTDEYDLPSYNFGASGQMMDMTLYYFEEALKTQSPRVVMVEVLKTVSEKSEANENAAAWSFVPMPLTLDKFRAVYRFFDGDVIQTLSYTVAPLMQWHNRWEELTVEDFGYLLKTDRTHAQRGYFASDNIVPHNKLPYEEESAEECTIPAENVEIIRQMAALAERENIQLIFFKAPSPLWTRAQSEAVMHLMEEEALSFIDLHEYIAEMGIDPQTDFCDASHLNTAGAEKVTRFLAEYLLDLWQTTKTAPFGAVFCDQNRSVPFSTVAACAPYWRQTASSSADWTNTAGRPL